MPRMKHMENETKQAVSVKDKKKLESKTPKMHNCITRLDFYVMYVFL